MYDHYYDPHHEAEAEGSGGGSGGGSSATTFIGTGGVDNVDKSSETVSWRLEGYSGNDVLEGGSAEIRFGVQLVTTL